LVRTNLEVAEAQAVVHARPSQSVPPCADSSADQAEWIRGQSPKTGVARLLGRVPSTRMMMRDNESTRISCRGALIHQNDDAPGSGTTIMSEPVTSAPIWPELHRSRRAIVVVDVVESVRLMQAHEDDHIDRWRRFVDEVRTDLLPAHGGRLVKSLG